MKTLTAIAAALLALAGPAAAQSAGEWTVGLGFGSVMPKDGKGKLSNGATVDVGNNTRPTVTLEYFVADNIGVELLAATPFQHDVSLKGIGKVASVKHLPPTLTLNYHIPTGGQFVPFVGAGLNYTSFFTERTKGALAGADLNLRHSFGLAFHVGADYWITPKSAIRADVRWMDIDSKVYVNGTKLGTAKIDPTVVGVSYIMKF